MKTRYFLTVVAFLSLSLSGLCQVRVISGTVTAFHQYPIEGIEVKARKSKAKATTDAEGKFRLEVKSKDVIVIKDPVFYSYETRITEEMKDITINLIYNDSGNNAKKVVSRGYMTQEQIDYGTRYLNRENNLYATFLNVFEAIEHALPEATVVTNADGSRGFILRGATSISGDNNALYVVNGSIVEDISYIVPGDIREINKLSNAQASMFGSRGANGVISINLYP